MVIRRLVLTAVTVLLWGVFWHPLAAAQPPDPKGTARQLGREGLKLFSQGRWQQAYDKFVEAQNLHRAPTLALYMARCQRNMNALIEARGLYESLVHQPLPDKPSKPFVEAQKTARSELADLHTRIPSVQFVIMGPALEQTIVNVDGIQVPNAELAQSRPVNPGKHTVTATAPGWVAASQVVELSEGEKKTVELSLTPLRSPTGPPPSVNPPPDPAPIGSARPPGDTSATSQGPLWPGIAALGVGAVGLGFGAVTGGLALTKANAIKDNCVDNHCLREDEQEDSSARSLATMSTVGLVLGGVFSAAGVVLLVWRPGGGGADSDRVSLAGAITGQTRMKHTGWALHFGPSGVGFQGRF